MSLFTAFSLESYKHYALYVLNLCLCLCFYMRYMSDSGYFLLSFFPVTAKDGILYFRDWDYYNILKPSLKHIFHFAIVHTNPILMLKDKRVLWFVCPLINILWITWGLFPLHVIYYIFAMYKAWISSICSP